MSAYGYYTKKDLTSIGNMAIMGLIGIIIASIVNMFIEKRNDVLDHHLSWGGHFCRLNGL